MLDFSMEGHFDARVGKIGVWICVKAVLQGVIWTTPEIAMGHFRNVCVIQVQYTASMEALLGLT